MIHLHSLKRTALCLAATILTSISGQAFSMDKSAPTPFTCQSQYTGLSDRLALRWFRPGQPNSLARRALDDLLRADRHGLNPADFQAEKLATEVSALRDYRSAGYPGSANARLDRLNHDMTRAVVCYLQQLHSGQLEPELVHARTMLRPKYWRSAHALQKAWANAAVTELLDSAAPNTRQYRLLVTNLARLRQQMALPQRIAQVELAMERIRWLPRDGGQRRVEVNIPEFKVRMTSRGRLLHHGKVVVGKPGRTATPLFAGRLSQVVLNPSWYVPHSIAKYTLLPKIRKDPEYIDRKNMLFTRKDGSEHHAVTDEILNLVASNEARIEQRPGAENALGNYKFVLPNRRAIFMHDTDQPELFDRDVRAYSSGCVRIEKPDQLARLLLRGSQWNGSRIRDQIDEGKTKAIRPRRPALVVLNYQTARAVSATKVRFFDDLYGMDTEAYAHVARWSRAFAPTTLLAGR